jgi:hypothetical protein
MPAFIPSGFDMRPSSLLLFAFFAAACDRPAESSTLFVLHRGQVALKMGCNVVLDEATSQNVTLRHACRVPLNEETKERWWGNRPEPTPITMRVQDCLLLEFNYYCVEEIEPGKSVSLRPTYMLESYEGDLIRRFKGRGRQRRVPLTRSP